MDLSEATKRIKSAGPTKTRIVPMDGQHVATGLYQVQIMEGTNWVAVLTNVPKDVAESLVMKSENNRVILG